MRQTYSNRFLIAHGGGNAKALRERLRHWGAKEIIANVWIFTGDWTAEVTRAQLAETGGGDAAIVVVGLSRGCDYAAVGATHAGLAELRGFGGQSRGH
jgi:hypothetical protein